MTSRRKGGDTIIEPRPGLPSARPIWVRDHADGATIAIAAQPGAKRSEVVGLQGVALKVRIAAPPVDGAATEALLQFLAEKLGVRRRDVELLRGATARQKLVLVRGIGSAQVEEILGRIDAVPRGG